MLATRSNVSLSSSIVTGSRGCGVSSVVDMVRYAVEAKSKPSSSCKLCSSYTQHVPRPNVFSMMRSRRFSRNPKRGGLASFLQRDKIAEPDRSFLDGEG